LVAQFELITPEFLPKLTLHVGVYDFESFMDLFLQSLIKMADISPGTMLMKHGAFIMNYGMLVRGLTESPTRSPLPVQL
jgi:hypothetical protein